VWGTGGGGGDLRREDGEIGGELEKSILAPGTAIVEEVDEVGGAGETEGLGEGGRLCRGRELRAFLVAT